MADENTRRPVSAEGAEGAGGEGAAERLARETIYSRDEWQRAIDTCGSEWGRLAETVQQMTPAMHPVAAVVGLLAPWDAQAGVEQACKLMHDAYEAAATANGWETQEGSRKPWADVPEANKATMRAAVRALLSSSIVAARVQRAEAEMCPANDVLFNAALANARTAEAERDALRERLEALAKEADARVVRTAEIRAALDGTR